jgi:hypothetical protein
MDESEPTTGPRRQRRRRRAVWRPGEGISRTVAPAPRPEQPPSKPPKPSEPREQFAHSDPSAQSAQSAQSGPFDPSAPGVRHAESAKRGATRPGRNEQTERGLRDIVGAGPSQLGPVRAMRARDANRPTAADLAKAEQEVELVRRNWKPPKAQ